MATDFGLYVGRHNTAKPSLSDDDLREIRLDVAGNLENRLIDGNDKTLSYYIDGQATGTGVGDHAGTAEDRGIIVLGKDDSSNTYQMLRVNPDGSLTVSFQSGTDISEFSDKAGTGEISLTKDTWVKVLEIPVASGNIHIDGWTYASDANTQFKLGISNDTGVDGHAETDITEIIDMHFTTSARPSDNINFTRSIDRAAGTNIALVVWAKQLQVGSSRIGTAMINAHKST